MANFEEKLTDVIGQAILSHREDCSSGDTYCSGIPTSNDQLWTKSMTSIDSGFHVDICVSYSNCSHVTSTFKVNNF